MEWLFITLLSGIVAGLAYWVYELQKDVRALQEKTRYML